MNTTDLMTSPAHSCRPGDSLALVARTMWERDLGLLPVLDDSNEVVATITDRDLCMGAYTQGRSMGELQVRDSMSSQAICARQDMPVGEALELMASHRVRRLPVVDERGRLVGMLGLADVSKALAMPEAAELVAPLLRALAAVSTPAGQETLEPVVELEPAARPATPPAARKKAAKKAAKKTSARKTATKSTTKSTGAKGAKEPAAEQATTSAAGSTGAAASKAPASGTKPAAGKAPARKRKKSAR